MGARDRAVDLAHRITGVLEPGLRFDYVRHELSLLAAAELCELIDAVVRGDPRIPPTGELVLAIAVALAHPTAEGIRAAAAEHAAEMGLLDVLRFVFRDPGRALEDNAVIVPDFGFGRPVTLGERKSLARRRDRTLLARILRDPSPDVVRILLENPSLTEDDVVRLCARRPLHPEVLREVFRSPRWIVRGRVRNTLVRNPWTPVDVAFPIALLLPAPDAREVAASEELAQAVRDGAERPRAERVLH